MGKRLALSVSQLNEYVRRLLQQDPLLYDVELKGEISNLKLHQTGTLFFTLKDEQAAISCVMYAQDALGMQVKPFEGMRAVVSGSVGLYTRGGQYQFYAKEIRPQGIGVLFERYQMLKERLEREGLFRAERKLPIPGFVDTVGVVSSPTGAVIHDIMSVALRRDSEASILLCPVRVQGAEAADEVVAAIELLDSIEHVSVIVVARGGGSIEDLWTFNEERVVRAVAACRKPIVSAIGHETDFTLCDFAADLRAPTPSAAAECVVPVRTEWIERLDAIKAALIQSAQTALLRHETALALAKARLATQHPARIVDEKAAQLHRLAASLQSLMQYRMEKLESQMEAKRKELAYLSPYHVLERGYAIVTRDGKPVMSASEVTCGDRLDIIMKDGRVRVEALEEKPCMDEGV